MNVSRPRTIAPGRRLPVLVWLHGGAFVGGSASLYRLDALAQQCHGGGGIGWGLFHKAVLISAPLLMRGARDEMRRYIGYAHQSSDPVTASNDRERLRADYATDSGSEDGIRRRSFRRPQPSLPPLLLHPPHRWARSAASLPAPGAADAADGGLLRQQRRTQCPRTSHLAGDADAMAAQQGQAPAGATSPQ